MQKQKAFTLIELLAVIVVLGVVALIVSPMIMKAIKRSEKATFERSVDGLLETVRLDHSNDNFLAPREYYYEKRNLILLTVGEKTKDETVGIKGKIEGKGFLYVDEDGVIHVENVCNKKYCANGSEQEVIITDNVTGEIPEVSKDDPMIKLKGEKTVYVNIGETYTELGVTAKTKSGHELEYTTEITLNGEVVEEIETEVENTYKITYKTSSNGKEVTEERTVVIVDMEPQITMSEGKETYVKEQEILINVSAIKPNTITSFSLEIKKNGEIIKTETVNGTSKTLTLNETGEYEVTVMVVDNNEHRNMTSRNYKIDSEPPKIKFTSEITLKANEVSGFKFKEDNTVKVSDNSGIVTWEVEGDLNSNLGDQTVTYVAIDEAGNETRKIRTFHIDKAKEPSINFSSPGSNGIWIGAQNITIYARIEIENDELTELKYQVDNGAEVTVPITNNKQMETIVKLNTTGRHSIKITATGKYGNTKEETIGEFLIDVTVPTVGAINGNTDSWTTSKTLTATLTDANSGVKYYALIKDSATKPAANSADWKAVTVGSSYNFSQNITANGTYYLWAKDSVGNISASKSVIVSKIDRDNPTAPTTMNFVYGDFTAVPNNSWTNTNLYAARSKDNNAPTGSTDATSGIAKYQISKDNKTWEDYSYVYSASETIYAMHVEGTHTRYFRAVDYAGNVSPSLSVTAKIDKTAPTAPTMNFSFGNWSAYTDNTWTGQSVYAGRGQTDQRPTGSTDALSGVAKYQISKDNKTWEDFKYVYSASDNMYSMHSTGTHTRYFRAVDNAGNVSPVVTKIAKIDKTTPTLTLSLASLTINVGTSRVLSTLYTTSFGEMGGSATCKNGTTTITNVNEIKTAGTYTIKCTATGNNGKSSGEKSFTLTLKDPKTFTEIMTGSSVITDPWNNKRYVGSNPNNYVKFNNENWRIIGMFGGQVKIVRATSLGKRAKDSTDKTADWGATELATYLNGTTSESYWYSIDAISKTYVDQTHTWTLGAYSSFGGSRSVFYNAERGTTVPTGYASTWNGKVGLIYPSDYGYSTSGSTSTCDSAGLGYWNTNTSASGYTCYANSWMKSMIGWTMTPHTSTGYSFIIYNNSTHGIGNDSPKWAHNVYPVVFLKTFVKVMSGTGSSTDPYILGT